MKRFLYSVAALMLAAGVASAQVGSLINYGAIIKDSLRLENAGAYVRLPDNGEIRWGDYPTPADGILLTASLTGARTWTLPDESGTLLTTATTFGGDVSGLYNNLQLGTGVVGSTEIATDAVGSDEIAANAVTSTEIADGAVTYAKLQNATGANLLLVSSGSPATWGELSAPTASGQVLTYNGTNLVWQAVSGTVPNGTVDGQLLRWNNTSSQWEAVGLSAGTGISISNTSGGITIANTGDVNAGDDLTTTTGFDEATGSDATVSGVYNALDIQLNSGVVGSTEIATDAVGSDEIAANAVTSTEIADGAVTYAKLQNATGANLLLVSSGSPATWGELSAPTASGQVLTYNGTNLVWQAVSGTVPNGTVDGQLLRWNNTSSQWEAVGLSAGTGISISNTSGGITIANTGDVNAGDDLTTTTGFDEATGSDATVSGVYNALDIQLNSGVVGSAEIATDAVGSDEIATDAVGSSEIADGSITDADISNSANIAVGKLAVTQNHLIVGSSGNVGSLLAPPSSGSGQVLTWNGSSIAWQTVSGTVPSGSAAGQLLLWDGSAWQAQAMSGDATINASGVLTIATDAVGSDEIAANAVGSSEIADNSITDTDISSTAGIAVSKLAAGSNGQVLVTQSGTPTWADFSTLETDPQVGTLSTGQVAFWDGSADTLAGSNDLYWDNTNSQLGIGTTSPQSKLHVHGSSIRVSNSTTGSGSGDGFAIELSGSDVQLRQNENASIQFRTNAGSGSDTVKMHLTAEGRLVFYNPSSGSLYRIDLPNNSGLGVGRVRAQGYVNYSSRAWKEQIRPIEGALDKVLRLTGVQYRWKPEYGGTDDIGFVMEDVAPVVPEVVDRHPQTGELTGMDYSRLTALLVEALKEEHRRNEELRSQLDQLRQMVEQLAARQQVTAGASNINVRVDGDWLGQNVPNPHDGTTTIPYYVPSGVGRAQLTISDASGRTVRTVELPARDMWGQVTLDMSLLSSGTYEYSLLFDGRVVATKQMQLVK